MHVDRLNRHQRAEPGGVLNDVLRHKPWIKNPIVCVDKDAFTPVRFAPFGDIDHTLEIFGGCVVAGLRAGGKDFDLTLRVHWPPLLFVRSAIDYIVCNRPAECGVLLRWFTVW